MKNTVFTNSLFITFAALLCTALWGSATPFIKTGYLCLEVEGLWSIILFAGIRFTLAGILTVLLYSIIERKFLFPKKENLKYVGVISVFQTILQYIFFYVGLANTSGVKGTILSGSSAFFSILVASLVFRQEKFTFKKIIACIIGFAGVVVVNLNGLKLDFNFFGDAFVIFSAISLAFSSVLMKIYSKHENPVVLSGYQFIIGGAVMVVIGLALGGTINLESAKGLAILIYLAFLSAVAYALWGILLKHNPVSKVTIFSFMTPVFGVILSKIMLTESSKVSAINVLIALVLICAGIITVNYQKKETTKNNQFIQMVKFTLFSISAGIIQVVSFTLLNEVCRMRYWPAYLISLILSIVWNFTFNRRYTFKSAANIPVAMTKLFAFYAVFTPVSTYLGHIAENSGINEYIVLIVTMLSNFVLEFLFCKMIVYRNQENTRK